MTETILHKIKRFNFKKSKFYGFIRALATFLIVSVIVIAVSASFVDSHEWIGVIFAGMGVLALLSTKYLFKIPSQAVYPDIIFGAIDNGVLVFAAALGASFAGVFGAIIGGVAGNTITDGIGGLFEGNIAEHQREYKIDNLRTTLSTCLGKMTGCLLGAGIALILMW